MVAINFPDSPTNGQEHAGYVWDATNNVWNRLPTLPALDLVNFSAVAPSNPQDGQFWFDTTVGKMYVYYNDGSSSQWVSTIGGLNELNAVSDVVISSATAGQALTYDGTNWVNGSAGKILQVVQVVKTDTFSTTSSSFTSVTGLSASITPSSASNKVLILCQFHGAASADPAQAHFRLSGGNATNYVGDAAGSRIQGVGQMRNAGTGETARIAGIPFAINYLDSPATTSSVTYELQAQRGGSAGATVYVGRSGDDADSANQGRFASSITLMEVAG